MKMVQQFDREIELLGVGLGCALIFVHEAVPPEFRAIGQTKDG